jgi:hypothetical protein
MAAQNLFNSVIAARQLSMTGPGHCRRRRQPTACGLAKNGPDDPIAEQKRQRADADQVKR